MISEALTFLMEHLKAFLETDTSVPEKVVFVDRDNGSIKFTAEAVSVLLVGIEEEKTLRAADPYARTAANGASQRVRPEIRLNLYVLFVTNFKEYKQGLQDLSLIIKHFQKNCVFDHRSESKLSGGIEKLIMELHTLSLSEQHELWHALGTTYLPSVLYKVKMIVFSDEQPEDMPLITEADVSVGRLP